MGLESRLLLSIGDRLGALVIVELGQSSSGPLLSRALFLSTLRGLDEEVRIVGVQVGTLSEILGFSLGSFPVERALVD